MSTLQMNLLQPHTEMAGQLGTVQDILRYALAGNATFTIRSKATGTRFTYKVRQAEDATNGKYTWFVSLLNGPDNEGDFCYMGILQMQRATSLQDLMGSDITFRFTKKSTVRPEAPGAKAFVWFWNVVYGQQRMPGTAEVWHEGRCGRCGRKLTVPSSVANGIGPDCATML